MLSLCLTLYNTIIVKPQPLAASGSCGSGLPPPLPPSWPQPGMVSGSHASSELIFSMPIVASIFDDILATFWFPKLQKSIQNTSQNRSRNGAQTNIGNKENIMKTSQRKCQNLNKYAPVSALCRFTRITYFQNDPRQKSNAEVNPTRSKNQFKHHLQNDVEKH